MANNLIYYCLTRDAAGRSLKVLSTPGRNTDVVMIMRRVLLVAGPLLLCAALATAAESPYAERVLARVDRLENALPGLTQAGEVAAGRLLAGGRLWLAGDRSFVLEALGRAGGLMMAKALAKPEDLKANDVLLIGSPRAFTPDQQALCRTAEEAGVCVVQLVPGDLPELRDAAAAKPLSTGMPAMIGALWAFTGELVAACTRQGKTPALYQSVLVPGGRDRNAPRLKDPWEAQTVPPVAAGVLAGAYLDAAQTALRQFDQTQRAGLRQAATLARQAQRDGHTAWFACLGHLPPELPKQPDDPGRLKFLNMNTPDKLVEQVKTGDVILYIGYYEPYGPWVETAHQAGAKIVTIVSGTPDRRAEDMGADLCLNGCWPFGDGVVTIPGYDIKVLPLSGFMQVCQYFMALELMPE